MWGLLLFHLFSFFFSLQKDICHWSMTKRTRNKNNYITNKWTQKMRTRSILIISQHYDEVFLDASTHLYERVCLSIGRPVCPLVTLIF